MPSSSCQISAGSVNHHYFIHHFIHQKKTTKNQHHRHHHQSLTAVYWSFVILAYLLVLKINIFLSSSLNLPLVRFGCLKPHHDPSWCIIKAVRKMKSFTCIMSWGEPNSAFLTEVFVNCVADWSTVLVVYSDQKPSKELFNEINRSYLGKQAGQDRKRQETEYLTLFCTNLTLYLYLVL